MWEILWFLLCWNCLPIKQKKAAQGMQHRPHVQELSSVAFGVEELSITFKPTNPKNNTTPLGRVRYKQCLEQISHESGHNQPKFEIFNLASLEIAVMIKSCEDFGPLNCRTVCVLSGWAEVAGSSDLSSTALLQLPGQQTALSSLRSQWETSELSRTTERPRN